MLYFKRITSLQLVFCLVTTIDLLDYYYSVLPSILQYSIGSIVRDTYDKEREFCTRDESPLIL